MSITVTCPSCGKTYAVGEQLAGKLIRCPMPDCEATIRVPTEVSPIAAVDPFKQPKVSVPPPLPPREERIASAPLSSVPVTKNRSDLDEKPQDPSTFERLSVHIAPDLDGSPRPKRASVMVATVLSLMPLLGLLVLGLTISGGFVLANKIRKLDLGDPWGIDDCLDHIGRTKNNETRLKAFEWLQKQPVDERSRGAVITFMENNFLHYQDPRFRLAGIKTLSTWWILDERDDRKVFSKLNRATNDPDPEVAESATDLLVQAIERFEPPIVGSTIYSELLNFLNSKNERLRQVAVNSLSKEGGPHIIIGVVQVYKYSDGKGAEAALQVLKKIDPEMVEVNRIMTQDAESHLPILQRAISSYYVKEGYFPATLKELTVPNPVDKTFYLSKWDLKDPWHRPYEYEPNTLHPTTFMPLIYSRGPPGLNRPLRNWES